jgi:hypothetical protein
MRDGELAIDRTRHQTKAFLQGSQCQTRKSVVHEGQRRVVKLGRFHWLCSTTLQYSVGIYPDKVITAQDHT